MCKPLITKSYLVGSASFELATFASQRIYAYCSRADTYDSVSTDIRIYAGKTQFLHTIRISKGGPVLHLICRDKAVDRR